MPSTVVVIPKWRIPTRMQAFVSNMNEDALGGPDQIINCPFDCKVAVFIFVDGHQGWAGVLSNWRWSEKRHSINQHHSEPPPMPSLPPPRQWLQEEDEGLKKQRKMEMSVGGKADMLCDYMGKKPTQPTRTISSSLPGLLCKTRPLLLLNLVISANWKPSFLFGQKLKTYLTTIVFVWNVLKS